ARNAGQLVRAPDFFLLPDGCAGAFAAACERAVARMFPTIKNNPDYTAIINSAHFNRLQRYLDDAVGQGAQAVEIVPAGEDFCERGDRRFPPTLLLNVTDSME